MDEDRLIQKIGVVIDEKINKALENALEPIKQTLNEHSEKLDTLTTTVEEHGEKIDILIAESHDTHELVRGVHDVVKGRYEKNKREIDEIKQHLNLPIIPPFGD